MSKKLPAYFSTGEGPAVVLLHCTLSSKNQWKPLVAMLERHHRVIALDLYGYGQTAMPEKTEGYSLLDEADLVRTLLDRLLEPGEKIHLVGHSFGGAVALRFCYQFPERVKTLTVFEPVAFHLLDQNDPGLESVQVMMRELARLMQAGLRREAASTFLNYWSDEDNFDNFPPRVQKDFTDRTEKLALDFVALTQTPLTLEEYRRISLPVTVIAGKKSRLPAQRVAQELERTLPDCRLVWVETGHMGPVSHPDLVNPLIVESFAR